MTRMKRTLAVVLSALSLTLAAGFAGAPMGGVAQAVVYCKTAGVPQGCVMAPSAATRAAVYCTRPGYPVGCVGSAPGARAAVHCTRPGYPAGCVGGAGAPGVGVTARPGVAGVGAGAPGVGVQPANRGGPVNRVGVR